ncbi:cation:proton antiporter [Micromonospora sp. NPDC005324]|uniref:cation:proton antiporter n=1 Tax=Micromonospora sp. NPDC005324 TaxID=3157033 RepID=UPI0033A4A611
MLPPDPLLPVLLAVPAVMLACHVGGRAIRRIGQPPVIGEILVGILLGPSLLGWLAPDLQHHLLPPAVLPVVSALGSLALLTFLFLIGAELDLHTLRNARHAVVTVSLGSILLPLALGAALALTMYPTLAPNGVGRAPFVLFVGVALSITAFPVLARVLADRNLETTYLGAFVMACAAINDAIAWCLLTAAIALSTTGSPLSALVAAALTAALATALVLLRPAMRKMLASAARSSDEFVLVILCAGLFLTAYATDQIGVHPALGAFLFGVAIPRGLAPVERSAARIRAVFVPVLLPLYFADIGLRTDIADLPSGQWGWAMAVLAVAVVGKWGGAAGAARLTGVDWRWAATIGTLMNCRGVTELVVLGIGLQIGVITPHLFTILVLMAVVTTAATAPLLNRLGAADPRLSPAPRHREGSYPGPSASDNPEAAR